MKALSLPLASFVSLLFTSLSCQTLSASSESVLDQLASDIYSSDRFSDRSLDEESLFAPSSDGDEDLGEQLILKRTRQRSPLRASLNSHLYYSNNVTNADTATQSGFIWSSRLEASWRPELKPTLFANVTAIQSFYQYENNVDLDFTNTQLEAGLIKIYPKYDIILTADLVHQIARRNFLSDKIHGVTSIRVGGYKTFFSNPQVSSYVALDLSADIDATNDSIKRNEATLRLGHTRKFSDSMKITFFADVSYYDYTKVSRDDVHVILGTQFEYTITENVSLFSSLSYARNNSDLSGLDYSTTLGSIGVGLKATF